MENSGRTAFHPTFPDRQARQRIIRLIATVSTLYGFWIIYDMDHYLPWQVRFAKGVEMSLLAHFGLWLATFEIRGRMRFLVAGPLLLSMVGVFFLWWTLHLFTAIAALGCVSWLFIRLIRGKYFDD